MTPLRDGKVMLFRPEEIRTTRARRGMRPTNAGLYRDLGLWLEGFCAPFRVEREYHFHIRREWPLDFAVPAFRFGVEVQGVWVGRPRKDGTPGVGGHGGITQMKRDCEKMCWALASSWVIAPVMYDHLRSGEAYEWLHAAIDARRKELKR